MSKKKTAYGSRKPRDKAGRGDSGSSEYPAKESSGFSWPSAPPVRSTKVENDERYQGRGGSLRGVYGQRKEDKRSKPSDKTWIGTVSAHPDGFGFVNVEGRDEDVFLSVEEMRDVMHGDKVEVRTFMRRGREAGAMVRMIEHAPSTMTGQFKIEHGLGFVYPRSKRMQMTILIQRDDAGGAHHGDWVRVEIQRGSQPLRGKILEVMGDDLTPTKLVDLIVAEQGLSATFPPDVESESQAIPSRVRAKDKQDRLDLTHLPFATIDGADARDFDDAICVQKRGDGYEAWVAIADVAHYVHEDSALDKEALSRGNSFYFPDRVIPMLPEKLSNGLCSLNPNVDRLAMVVRMRFDAGGKRRTSRVYNAVIYSYERLTYEKATAWIDNQDKGAVTEPKVRDMLDTAMCLYQILQRNRSQRGALEIDAPEVRAVIDGDKVADIELRERHVSHQLIEEMMLAANTAVAEFLDSKKVTQLYRVHPAPEREAIEKLNTFLAAFALKIRLHKTEDVRPKDVQQALAAAEGKPFSQVLHKLVLRSMQQAKYTTNNVGHFGLAYDCYGHFTSPIRRYADLTTHRRLKAVLAGEKASKQDLEAVGAHISTQERIQQRAEWDTQAMLAALYHHKDIGKTMEAVVSGVTKRKVFFALKETLAEAALDVDELQGSFDLDDVHHRLTSKRSGFTIGLGDTMQVEIENTDAVRGQIKVRLITT
ncbi:MAG: ribonuclease R [Ghiorsea sp.]|nr:ribonuclease R [Ghiorsea sp.]